MERAGAVGEGPGAPELGLRGPGTGGCGRSRGPVGAGENGAMRPCDAGVLRPADPLGRVPCGEAASSVGVLDWRRAKTGLWGGCQGWPGGLLRGGGGSVWVRVWEPAGSAHKTGPGTRFGRRQCGRIGGVLGGRAALRAQWKPWRAEGRGGLTCP